MGYPDRALEIDPEFCLALFQRGAAYLGLDDKEKATKDLRRVAEIEPGFLDRLND